MSGRLLRLGGTAVCALIVMSASVSPARAQLLSEKDSAGESQAAASAPGVVPVFRLNGPIQEQATPDELSLLLGGSAPESLRDLVGRLKAAAADEEVPAAIVLLDTPVIGRAQAQELSRAMQDFRRSGKKIHLHCAMLTTGQYALAAAADDISVVPTGMLFITGIYGEQMFLRGMLDKIGVVPDYFTCGDFKSAGETFMRTGPSDESREMTTWLYDGIFEDLVLSIAAGRNTDADTVREWIDKGLYTAEDALPAGLIDAVEQKADFEDRMKSLYGAELKFDRGYGRPEGMEIDLSSPFGVLNFYAELLSPRKKQASGKPAVGIVYLQGPIMPGSGGGNPLLAGAAAFSDEISRSLRKAEEDDDVKAVVFRIDSPGGSAVASETILAACRRVASKKPVIVSMGDVAGSGGYYVACAAQTIFVDESTITGSIGVVSGKFATTGLWDKIGINWSPVQRGENAGLLSTASVFSESERAAMQTYMDQVYDVFKGHVVKARGDRLSKDIEELAGGRVYTGRQAVENGLADRIGGLTEAVAFAAQQASLESGYEVRVVPEPKSIMEVLMGDLTGGGEETGRLSLPAQLSGSRALLDAVLPLIRNLDPHRAAAVRQALMQMAIMQHEQIALTMPVIID